MLDIDRELHAFLRTLSDKSLVSKDCLDEVEDHLRCEIELHMESGISPDEAFVRAIKNFGATADLLAEYQHLYGNSKLSRLKNYLSHYFNRRIIMRFLGGFLFGAFFILAGLLLEGGQIASITQITSFIIVFGGTIGGLFIAYPIKSIKRTFVLVLTGRNAVQSAYFEAAQVCKSFGDLSLFAGGIGGVLGLIHVFENMSEYPDMTGAGLAVSVTPVLYALIVKLFIGKALHESFMARARGLVNSDNDSGSFKPTDLMSA